MYTPAPADVFRPGLLGDNDQVRSTIQQTAEAYLDYGPPIFYGAVSLSTTSDSDELVAEFDLPANEDQCPIYFKVVWRGTDTYTATMTLQIVGNVVDDEVVTRTSTSWGSITRTITPTSVGDDRLARIYLRQSTSGQLAQIAFIGIGYAPQGLSHPAGPLPSGYVSTSEWESGWDTDQPMPSELVQRALNNMAFLARDRPAGLAGGVSVIDMGGTQTPGPMYESASSTWETVERWLQPGSDIGLRWYRLTAKLEGGGDCRIIIGSCVWEFTGDGRHSTVVQLSLGEAEEGVILLRGATLVSWQMMRTVEPVTYDPVLVGYQSDSAAGDYLEVALPEIASPFPGTGLQGIMLSLWFSLPAGSDVGADRGVFEFGTDGLPTLHAYYGDGDFAVVLYDDVLTAGGAEDISAQSADGDLHHLIITSKAEAPQFDVDGMQLWYDGVSANDGAGLPPGVLAVAANVLRIFGRYDGTMPVDTGLAANIAIFNPIPPAIEYPSLTAAGPTHDVRNPTGRWQRRKPRLYYRDADVGGEVPNVGTAGVAPLVMSGETWTVDL